MRRVAVKIAYLGKAYCGSQYQPELRTAIGDVLSDLQTVSGNRDIGWFNLKVASRTDAGVNALENVIVFNTEFDDLDDMMRALNSVSKGIFYRSVAEVDGSFNPRFADGRVYRYLLQSDGLDIRKVRDCAQLFVGEHDFVRFCRLYDKSTVMTIDSIDVSEEDGHVVLVFKARYFLWNMIRKITAAIASVARGDRTEEDIRQALCGKDINFGLARPDALTLTEIIYDSVHFRTPTRKAYSERVVEELFSDMIRNDFFRML